MNPSTARLMLSVISEAQTQLMRVDPPTAPDLPDHSIEGLVVARSLLMIVQDELHTLADADQETTR